MRRAPAAIAVARRGVAPIPDATVRRAIAAVLHHARASGAVSVAFVGPREMRRLNRTFRGEDRATDVLAFGQASGVRREASGVRHQASGVVERQRDLGEIIVCPSVVRRNAVRAGESVRRECARVLVHGTLHLLGYDHDTPRGAEQMFLLQEQCIQECSPSNVQFPNPNAQ